MKIARRARRVLRLFLGVMFFIFGFYLFAVNGGNYFFNILVSLLGVFSFWVGGFVILNTGD